MAQGLKYVIFRSRWGWFGLLANEKALLRTSLPVADRDKAESVLLKGIAAATFDRRLFPGLQGQIKAYFEADCVDFADACVELDGFSGFSEQVLITCRQVEYGRTVSYGRLAELAHRPGAGRAVGNILAKNPVPLIIPCHRVIRKDGKIGGFSAVGGISFKKKMLELEARTEDS
jgi:O-6-methylguanine DNA methyltransferase